jgi:hypothetical protein
MLYQEKSGNPATGADLAGRGDRHHADRAHPAHRHARAQVEISAEKSQLKVPMLKNFLGSVSFSPSRVARWYFFETKVQIFVIF